MTHQVMNGSFGKVLAAAALGFMLSSAAPVQAQQGQWGSDNCLYARGRGGQMVRQGCISESGGRRFFTNLATKVHTDMSTGDSYFLGQNGRWLILTRNGWVDLVAAVQANRAAQAAQAAQSQTRTSGYVGPSSTTIGGPSWVRKDTFGRPYPESVYNNPAMVNNMGSADRANNRLNEPVCTPYSPCISK
jgi:hypothetical protein